MATTRWQIDHDGRRIEIEPDSSSWSGNVVRMFVDGEQVAEVKKGEKKLAVEHDGLTVKTWLSWTGGTIQRAELTAGDDAEPLPLEPRPGSRAARREAWAREHPGLYSARHAAKGVGEVLIGLVGFAFLLRLLAALLPDVSIDLPEIDLPLPSISIPLPQVDAPDVDLPELPGWIRAIAASSKYWLPILIGLAIALGEYDRRSRQAQRRKRDGEAGDRPETPAS
jgi:hypothetical protein